VKYLNPKITDSRLPRIPVCLLPPPPPLSPPSFPSLPYYVAPQNDLPSFLLLSYATTYQEDAFHSQYPTKWRFNLRGPWLVADGQPEASGPEAQAERETGKAAGPGHGRHPAQQPVTGAFLLPI
jgi:hypothetical protein